MIRRVSFCMVLGLGSFSLLSPFPLIIIYVLVGLRSCYTSIIVHSCTPVPLAICDIGTEYLITFANLLTSNIEPARSSRCHRHDEGSILLALDFDNLVVVITNSVMSPL